MLAVLAGIAAFVGVYLAGRRALWLGALGVIGCGYLFGIVRANLLHPAAHFFYDAAVLGFYATQPWRTRDRDERRAQRPLKAWLQVLCGWAFVLCLLPFQMPLVSLVGLRGFIFFLPALLAGVRLKHEDMLRICYGLAALNLVALAFAGGEYVLGVPRFYPYSPVTQIIYSSADVAGGFYRIPGTFSNAHSYAGTMVSTIPLLLGAWAQVHRHWIWRVLVVIGLGAAGLGVLMASTRQFALLGGLMCVLGLLVGGMSRRTRAVWLVLLVGLGALALTNERFQRFKSIDTETMTGRVAISVNRTFLEILLEYPMGNGLGGGGTSIPHFLQYQVRRGIACENEYARILAEQGIIGLLLWVGFFGWVMIPRWDYWRDSWRPTRILLWTANSISIIIACIGTGLLTSIPGTFMIMLLLGWLVTGQRPVRHVATFTAQPAPLPALVS